MSNLVPSTTTIPPLLEALRTAPTAPDAKSAANALAQEVKTLGYTLLEDAKILQTLQAFCMNKKSGYERESGAMGFQSLATILGTPVGPLLIPSLPTLFDLYMDKGDVVREAATAAVKAILKIFPPEALSPVLRNLEVSLKQTKQWKSKVGVLDAIKTLANQNKEQVGEELGTTLPHIELAMHDTKAEVSSAAIKCGTALCATLPNPDLLPHVPALVKCMADPQTVAACIKALSNTTFVAEVTAPALAVLVPLLTRALNDRSMEVQRRTVVVIDNLVKLVRDPKVAARYLSGLVDGVDKIMKGASFPENLLCERFYLFVLHNSSSAWIHLKLFIHPSPHSLEFSASLVADLVYDKTYDNTAAWKRSVGSYLSHWLSVYGASEDKDGSETSERIREHFYALYKAQFAPKVNGNSEEGELLCETLFSLAYGALLLLSHTTLRLIRGRRYGILAPNGSGKSTLLRAIRDGKVENFPPQEVLRAVMVEHALQGEDASLPIIDFIASDKQLQSTSRADIAQQLRDVGFDDARQVQPVGSLSGGWKMKLELARAMLYKADLLLLDEPTNHLDRASVRWLEDWLKAQANVTCLIVSHDSGFLDNITTDIIHYETKKLVYYPGNLSKFVEIHPEAKSYYTLAATSIKFAFPPPGSLMGVRSNTRAIMKMTNCTFTYPGRDKPSLIDVSCALSLSSRVGIIGPNGAGKSTLIKLLTGETTPQEGTVYKHPSLRVGYVSQHATHHIDRHLEKTAIQYIQWRFQDGHDREVLEKSTRVLTEEEKKVLDQDFVGKNGEKRKIEFIMGRQKLKKSLRYEIKWRGLDHKFNTWLPREELLEKGFTKIVQQFDDLEASREGAGSRETTLLAVRKVLEDVGLDGDIAQYNEMGGLSGGQKVKVVIAAALWNNPQIVVLDEPTNFLDREALGGLAVAIRDWAGAVVIISHNEEFVGALCPEIWNIDAGRLTHKGKVAIVDDAFLDKPGKWNSGFNTPAAASRGQTPAASAQGTPAASGDEGSKPASGVATPASGTGIVKKKKKLTRNQLKAQADRRKARQLHWLTFGGPKPEDTDSD
ncbi:probable mrna export factor elf1 [Serendipita indica DSM 11827]|uniref:Probable mrna export factor elf1 n=1 Tax=Serendipita indica (strain DSM 11827) TaxID=1109443 RepID=G4T756_SERID|nr:probable mrna export factor elf1 [Serendipita indica DSM 11827]